MLALAAALVVDVVVQQVMKAPEALLSRLALTPGTATGSRRLAVVMGQLGDFDSLEYAQALVPRLDSLRSQGVTVQVFAIGDAAGRALARLFVDVRWCWVSRNTAGGVPRLHGRSSSPATVC